MSDGLDFSDLTDDQIVGLAVGLAREAMSRNPALQAAFAQALLDERERVEAAARGSEAARQREAARIEKQAARAEVERLREQERRRINSALGSYLKLIAAQIGRPTNKLTLVWRPLVYGRESGNRLQINLGATGLDASWHLVDFAADHEKLYTSPGLHSKQSELLPVCREVCAAIRALGANRAIIIKGIEL